MTGLRASSTLGLSRRDSEYAVRSDQVTNPAARRSGAETDNACQISFPKPPATGCMRETLTAHERQHQIACMQAQDKTAQQGAVAEFLSIFSSWRDATSLVDMANKERAAYGSEIAFLNRELSRISRAGGCPSALQPSSGSRDPSFQLCPAPRPRPPPDQSACKHR